MHFFLEYLSHFTASEILNMYADGSFRTCQEIKVADFSISFKIVFEDDHISSEDLDKYRHLQKVVDAIRVHQQEGKTFGSAGEFPKYFSTEAVYFNYFVKYSELECEAVKLNVYERRIIFSFHPVTANSTIIWLKDALEELLTYVLRDFTEADRVGLVINYEHLKTARAAFPIKSRNHLKASIIFDTLTSLVRTRGTLVTGRRMNMQVVRIRLPILYRELTVEDVARATGSNI